MLRNLWIQLKILRQWNFLYCLYRTIRNGHVNWRSRRGWKLFDVFLQQEHVQNSIRLFSLHQLGQTSNKLIEPFCAKAIQRNPGHPVQKQDSCLVAFFFFFVLLATGIFWEPNAWYTAAVRVQFHHFSEENTNFSRMIFRFQVDHNLPPSKCTCLSHLTVSGSLFHGPVESSMQSTLSRCS